MDYETRIFDTTEVKIYPDTIIECLEYVRTKFELSDDAKLEDVLKILSDPENKRHSVKIDVDIDMYTWVEVDDDEIDDYVLDNSYHFNNLLSPLSRFGSNLLYDMKMSICEKACEEYSLDEIEKRLGFDWL